MKSVFAPICALPCAGFARRAAAVAFVRDNRIGAVTVGPTDRTL